MIYLKFGVRFNSIMQNYMCSYAPGIKNGTSTVLFLIFVLEVDSNMGKTNNKS